MGRSCDLPSHGTWNHELWYHAPQPHEPEASHDISTVGEWDGAGRNDTPFHLLTNALHQARSQRNPVLRRMGMLLWGGRCTLCRRSIMRRRNERPERTTLHAWLRRPMGDSSSLREQDLRSPHSSSKACNRWSLSVGRHSMNMEVLISMPRNTKQVVGPSRLCSAIGTPRAEQTWSNMVKHFWLSGEPGGVTTIKSSK